MLGLDASPINIYYQVQDKCNQVQDDLWRTEDNPLGLIGKPHVSHSLTEYYAKCEHRIPEETTARS